MGDSPRSPGQQIGQAQTAFCLAQQNQATVRGDQAAVEGSAHFLAPDGWQIKGKKAIVRHGECGGSLFAKKLASTTNFYTMTTSYAMSTNPKSGSE